MQEEPFEIAVIDGEAGLTQQLGKTLSSAQFHFQRYESLEAAGSAFENRVPDFFLLVFTDPTRFGLQDIASFVRSWPESWGYAILGQGMAGYEDALLEAGIRLLMPEALTVRQIAQILLDQGRIRQLESQNYRLRQMIETRSSYEGLVGISSPMQSLYRLLDQVARADAPVLITGEEGCEHVEVARAIHARSGRRNDPLIVIDCETTSKDPQGKEVFGPVGRGEFGSGPCAKTSVFARAGKGGVVLDHIERLSPGAQKRLLDFLNRPFFQNETSMSPQPVARIMVTAGANLLGEVEAGRFHRELFYRLNILQVRIPALRERCEDIPLLVQHLQGSANGNGRNGGAAPKVFSTVSFLHLFQYGWKRNLSELKEVVSEAVSHARSGQVEPTDLPAKLRKAEEPANGHQNGSKATCRADLPLKEAKRIFETEYFRSLLKQTHGNMTLASRQSRVGRPYLYKKIRECGINPEQFR